LPLRPGLLERQTHDYVRYGATTLFAALEVATDRISAGTCYPRHSNVEFLALLKKVAKAHPRVKLRVVVDNYANPQTLRCAELAGPEHSGSPCISPPPVAPG
jgi:hypothetical protein